MWYLSIQVGILLAAMQPLSVAKVLHLKGTLWLHLKGTLWLHPRRLHAATHRHTSSTPCVLIHKLEAVPASSCCLCKLMMQVSRVLSVLDMCLPPAPRAGSKPAPHSFLGVPGAAHWSRTLAGNPGAATATLRTLLSSVYWPLRLSLRPLSEYAGPVVSSPFLPHCHGPQQQHALPQFPSLFISANDNSTTL